MPNTDSPQAAAPALTSSAFTELVRLLARQAAAEWLANRDLPTPDAPAPEVTE